MKAHASSDRGGREGEEKDMRRTVPKAAFHPILKKKKENGGGNKGDRTKSMK